MKRAALIIAGLGIAAGVSAPAIASALDAGAAAGGGRIQVFETPSLTGNAGTVVITGAIGDYGRSVKINKAGRTDANGTYSRLELRKGTIISNGTMLNKRIKVGEEHAQVDLSSCSLQGSVSAPVPIVSGTGAYAGITGTVKVKFTLGELGTTFASGPKRGQCNPGGNVAAAWASVVGTGAISFK